MAPSDSRSVNRCGHGHLACKFPINVTVPLSPIARLAYELSDKIKAVSEKVHHDPDEADGEGSEQ